jgi:hypothetical protein
MAEDPKRDAARRRRERIAAGLAIAASGVLAFFCWSWLWVLFVIACSVVFPALGLRTITKYEKDWKVPTPPADLVDRRLEYQEASEDWRHRDRLTWQMPPVVMAALGLVFGQVYIGTFAPGDEWIRVAILVVIALSSGGLVLTLKQNLSLQNQSREIITSIYRDSGRLGFAKVGSNTFFRLMRGAWLTLSLFTGVECWNLVD